MDTYTQLWPEAERRPSEMAQTSEQTFSENSRFCLCQQASCEAKGSTHVRNHKHTTLEVLEGSDESGKRLAV